MKEMRRLDVPAKKDLFDRGRTSVVRSFEVSGEDGERLQKERPELIATREAGGRPSPSPADEKESHDFRLSDDLLVLVNDVKHAERRMTIWILAPTIFGLAAFLCFWLSWGVAWWKAFLYTLAISFPMSAPVWVCERRVIMLADKFAATFQQRYPSGDDRHRGLLSIVNLAKTDGDYVRYILEQLAKRGLVSDEIKRGDRGSRDEGREEETPLKPKQTGPGKKTLAKSARRLQHLAAVERDLADHKTEQDRRIVEEKRRASNVTKVASSQRSSSTDDIGRPSGSEARASEYVCGCCGFEWDPKRNGGFLDDYQQKLSLRCAQCGRFYCGQCVTMLMPTPLVCKCGQKL